MKRLLLVALAIFTLTGCDQYMMGSGIIHRGQKAPAVHTKKLADVDGDMGKITSYHFPIPAMYRYSEDEALKLGKPLVLEFATPAHCTQCDKQLQLLKMLMRKYGDKVVVLHFDQYYNPEAYRAFKVRGEPWTVLLDRWGTVRRLYPGRTLEGEIDPMLAKLVSEKTPPVTKQVTSLPSGKKTGG
ncbi:MAG: thioredoxin [Mariprofundaceae bacterium]|nr:thioredoxin [Mariprofundaceae bacterium]